MIPLDTAQQLFDVTISVWQRWTQFGWLPASSMIDGQPAYPTDNDPEREYRAALRGHGHDR